MPPSLLRALQELRKQRKAEEVQANVEQAKQWRDKALDSGRKVAREKRKRGGGGGGGGEGGDSVADRKSVG